MEWRGEYFLMGQGGGDIFVVAGGGGGGGVVFVVVAAAAADDDNRLDNDIMVGRDVANNTPVQLAAAKGERRPRRGVICIG